MINYRIIDYLVLENRVFTMKSISSQIQLDQEKMIGQNVSKSSKLLKMGIIAFAK